MAPKEDSSPFWRAVQEFKRDYLTHALQAHNGNRTYAARALGLQRTFLLAMIRHMKIDVPRGK